MKILYIYRHPNMGVSIGKVFRPIEEEMQKYAEVDSIYMPESQYTFRGLLKNIKAVKKALKDNDYDIIHITGTEHYLLPFLFRYKTIVTIHDLGHFFNINGIRKLKFWLMQILSLRFAKAITCISDFTVDELKKAISINDNKINVIPNEIDKNFVFKEKNFNANHPLILHIGTRPHKNLSRTIEALHGIECKLRIIGRISEEDKELLCKHKIEYSSVSNISDDDLLNEYYNADIINFPSWHEGFGMPIIEGQAIGRIVLTSDIEPMKSVAGKGAVICNPYNIKSMKDAYIRIINDAIYRDSIIKKGTENVQKYHIDIITKQYLKLYKTL